VLKLLRVPWVARKALAKASRTVHIEHDGPEWVETIITAVMSKTSTMTIDGSVHQEISPVDKTAVAMTPFYADDGACVRSRHVFADGQMVQVISRYVIDDGATYMVHNQLLVQDEVKAEAKSYFARC